LRSEHEKTINVEVITFADLTSKQLDQLTTSLSQRLQRKVSLNTRVDQSILGGAVIRAGDLVIDGSVRGKLNQLGADLVV
jgi:F-type H+-transporting ATPase subunit delta